MRTMHTITRRSPRLVIAICVVLLGSTALRAQVTVAPPPASGPQDAASVQLQSPPDNSTPFATAIATSPATDLRGGSNAATRPSSRGLVRSMYVGLVVTQALDVHSTLRALGAGHTEANPMVRWATSHPAALIGFKTATTGGLMFLVERVRKKSPKGAIFLLAAINSAAAFVVAHNYSVPVPGR